MSDIQAPNVVNGNDRVKGPRATLDSTDMVEKALTTPKRQKGAGKPCPCSKPVPLHAHSGLVHWKTANHPS
jgi:hypothetical protein